MIEVDFRSLDDEVTYFDAKLPELPAVGDTVVFPTNKRFTVVDRPRLWFPHENLALQKVVVYVEPETAHSAHTKPADAAS